MELTTSLGSLELQQTLARSALDRQLRQFATVPCDSGKHCYVECKLACDQLLERFTTTRLASAGMAIRTLLSSTGL